MSKKVLNVGGNSKAISIPKHFEGWTHDLLDIDPRGKPDIVCDARKLTTLAPDLYDAVYCSHNLEHYFAHDVPKVLRGFHHVLKPDGFAEIRVPDIALLMRTVVEKDLDLLGPCVCATSFMASARRSSAPAKTSTLTKRVSARSPWRSCSEKTPLHTKLSCAVISRSAAMPSSRGRKASSWRL
jgi:SAM-dependent methyltransferase